LAKHLGFGKESARRWALQAELDGGQRAGASSEELAEIKALKTKVRRLEERQSDLNVRVGFLRRGTRPRNR